MVQKRCFFRRYDGGFEPRPAPGGGRAPLAPGRRWRIGVHQGGRRRWGLRQRMFFLRSRFGRGRLPSTPPRYGGGGGARDRVLSLPPQLPGKEGGKEVFWPTKGAEAGGQGEGFLPRFIFPNFGWKEGARATTRGGSARGWFSTGGGGRGSREFGSPPRRLFGPPAPGGAGECGFRFFGRAAGPPARDRKTATPRFFRWTRKAPPGPPEWGGFRWFGKTFGKFGVAGIFFSGGVAGK